MEFKPYQGKKLPVHFVGINHFQLNEMIRLENVFILIVISIFQQKRSRSGGNIGGKPVQPNGGCTLKQYAYAKKLPIEFLTKLGLNQITYLGKPAVRIPYYDQNEKEAAVKFRIALHNSKEADNRFRWKSGSKPIPYGLWKLDDAKQIGYLNLNEGMFDIQTLWYHGFPALGFAGARCWKTDWEGLLEGIPKIFINIEPDSGGRAVKEWIGASNFKDRVFLIDLSPYKDPSELHIADPKNFKQNWLKAIDNAIPYNEIHKLDIEKRKKELWQKCSDIATHQNILNLFTQRMNQSGVIGEDRAIKLIYLGVTSRFLDRPISLALKGPSSVGKSLVTEKILETFPTSAYYPLTAMSERALAYSEEPISHRFLVLYEAAGMNGNFCSYLLRSLLSEGRLRYEVVDKTKNGLKIKFIEREGPTGLIVTTTALSLHPENETRLISIPIDDSAEQTKSILKAIANGKNNDVNFNDWIAFQEWSGCANHEVDIPYAEQLAELIPPIGTRLRRDFSAILNFIKANAILHQKNRVRNKKNQIIETLDDYKAVRELIVDLISEGIEVSVASGIRETVAVVQKIGADEKEGVTVKEISNELKLDKSAGWRRVRSAIEKGYLKNLEEMKGRPARIVLGDPLLENTALLPTVEQLEGCKVASDSEGNDGPPIIIDNQNEIQSEELSKDMKNWTEKCYACGSTDFWKKECGQWVCNIFHPRSR